MQNITSALHIVTYLPLTKTDQINIWLLFTRVGVVLTYTVDAFTFFNIFAWAIED